VLAALLVVVSRDAAADWTHLGTIEEWRLVDCLMCSVIALRAGPVAFGPLG
jgi:hypothetical protein